MTKRAATTPAFDAAAWAKGRKHATSRTCGTCANKPAAQAIRAVLGVMARREGRPTWADLHAQLAQHCGYRLSLAAMKLHINQCERELLNAAREG